MLPGVSGHLLSTAFIERHLVGVHTPDERVRRELRAWRAACAGLGPASTPRTLLQSAAAPLCAVLGFNPPGGVEQIEAGAAATVAAADSSVALIVVPWAQ